MALAKDHRMNASVSPITDLTGIKDLPRWFGTVFETVNCIARGRIDVQLPDGRWFRADGPEPGPHGVIIVHDNRVWPRTVKDGADIGFAEAYVDGWWSTPDLHAILDVSLLNNEEMARNLSMSLLARLIERTRHWLRRNSRGGSKRNIMAHYDLGNAFYETWLDGSMTYSSALFTQPGQSLEAGQDNKYAALCDALQVKPDDTVLEVGCGWGGFAEFAARERGAKINGITISPAQLDYAQKRIFEAGLAERVNLELRDYRAVEGEFDHVASIEMFEAVGEQYWPVYFETLRDRLKPGGTANLQIITIADNLFENYRRNVDFVQKHIFPGGMLPSRAALRQQTERAGLTWRDSIEFGDSYSETLRRWSVIFNDRWDEIAPLGFDDRFRRLWNFYLASCAACFLAKTTDVTQLSLIRS
jgi:cyclopropane-fatty-acyl-phospholipid synthase